jgi:hypothetical protein
LGGWLPSPGARCRFGRFFFLRSGKTCLLLGFRLGRGGRATSFRFRYRLRSSGFLNLPGCFRPLLPPLPAFSCMSYILFLHASLNLFLAPLRCLHGSSSELSDPPFLFRSKKTLCF